MVIREGLGTGDPLAGTVHCGDAAVQRLGNVQGHERTFGCDGVEPFSIEVKRLVGAEAGFDVDSRGLKRAGTAGGGVVGIIDGVNHLGDPSLNDGLCAGTGAAHVVAGLGVTTMVVPARSTP